MTTFQKWKWIACSSMIAVNIKSASLWADSFDRTRGPALLGQSASQSKEISSPEKLLALARTAIVQGKYQEAEAFIVQAEKSQGRFYLPRLFGDTPKKAREALDEARRNSRPVDKSSRRSDAAARPQPPIVDPFLARKTKDPHNALRIQDSRSRPPNRRTRDSGLEQMRPVRLPKITQPTPLNAPKGISLLAPTGSSTTKLSQSLPIRLRTDYPGEIRTKLTNPTLPKRTNQIKQPLRLTTGQKKNSALDDRSKKTLTRSAITARSAPVLNPAESSQPRLLSARKALAVGDIQQAKRYLKGAEEQSSVNASHGDSPARLEEMIRQCQEVAAQGSRSPNNLVWRHRRANLLLEQATELLKWKDFKEAERLATDAARLKVRFDPFETNPQTVLEQIASARQSNRTSTKPPPDLVTDRQPMVIAENNAEKKVNRQLASLSSQERPDPRRSKDLVVAGTGALLNDGYNRTAIYHEPSSTNDEPPRPVITLQNHQDKSHQETIPDPVQPEQIQVRPAIGSRTDSAELIDRAADAQLLLTRQLTVEVAKRQSEARRILEKTPKRSLELLLETKQLVTKSSLEPEARAQLVRRIDLSIQETEKFFEDNQAKLELEKQNRTVLKEIERRRRMDGEKQQKLATLVEKYNTLRDEQRFEEMEVVAKRARELDPENPVTQQLYLNARAFIRLARNRELNDRKETAVFEELHSVDEAVANTTGRDSIVFPDAHAWEELTHFRDKQRREQGRRQTERDLEIQQKLKTPVRVSVKDMSLGDVMDYLAQLSDVNIHVDPRGLAEEGVSSETLVNFQLHDEISLRSALNLILEPLHLSYVIKDEVLKITSEQLRDGEIYPATYYVADLVTPIPDFVGSSELGLPGAIKNAHAQMLPRGPGEFFPPAAVGMTGAMTPTNVPGDAPAHMLGQVFSGSMNPAARLVEGTSTNGMGGAAQADFESLIELITTTIAPDSWEDVGGPGSLMPFDTNLSLVVSQTQEVHEQIADLLEQLRRLQDLQVTIEVRFITLRDNFFERIGVDFDLNIPNRTRWDSADEIGLANTDGRRVHPSATVGVLSAEGSGLPSFQPQLNIPFVQQSFSAAIPQFGGATDIANFGFAILSDIEAYFLIRAAQGDQRSNILAAPKVTLFNGQQAFVSDTVQEPFVISVTPVVGDFAAAQQPVIVVLSEGTALNVQAVVSSDRRFVRLTLVPFFSQIGDVDEFTFEGTTTSAKSSSKGVVDDDDDQIVASSESDEEYRQGTTVQLPSFGFQTVTTTVSVPDGGTVLLGGIKRLAEARTEFGVPLLSKVPYINRLFRNVAIGRQTESLMMMVTPRIIIHEEEEEALLGTLPQ